ncbi:MAG TPA: lysophospholipid acyltransferase family protein [Blastocatellia bacterium]|nr:lysophospholipid acyltransferase family protein [Blastocatellia bacterium]
MVARKRSALRNLFEFIPAWLLLKVLGFLPRGCAMSVGKIFARIAYHLHGRLRRVGHRNLELAMPELSAAQRRAIVKRVFDNLGRLLGEFSQFPKITHQNISKLVEYDGFENYEQASRRGRGVLLLTGHVGAWELCAFAQGAYGHPLSFLVRPLDNPLLDEMVGRYREISGNQTIDKNRSVKPVLEVLRGGGDVGLLIDVNTLPDQGVFCDFFEIPACSTTGLAVFALRADAPVVPGFLIWDERARKHRLRFEPEVPLIRTGDFKEEVALNTARFTKVIEEYARRYPEQWLWVHKRWHTRPDGEPNLYGGEAVKADRSRSLSLGVEV